MLSFFQVGATDLNPKNRLRLQRILEYGAMVLLAGIMVALYFVGRVKERPEEKVALKYDLEMKDNVYVARFEDGLLKFTMRGKDLRIDQTFGRAWIDSPVIIIKRGEEAPVTVTAGSGKYLSIKKLMVLADGVEIKSEDYVAETPELFYSTGSKTVESEEVIKVSGKGMELTGKGYLFNLESGDIEIRSNVKGRFEKQKG
jgi:LPS export ABC transporter protein LptC